MLFVGRTRRLHKTGIGGIIMNKSEIEQLRGLVIERVDMSREPDDSELHEIIDSVIEKNQDYRYMSIKKRQIIHKEIYSSIRGLGIIEELLEEPDITEIMINGPNNIFVEKKGRINKIDERFESENRLNDIIQQIVAKTNRRVNESNPIVDTRLEDGSRVNVILPPIALEGPIVTIRKFSKRGITIDDMISWGTISKEAADFLKMAVMAGYNIFVSGGTGSGKTTFLNVLSNFIPKDERIVTIEDSAELKLDSVDNIVRMETRQANSQGENVISIRDLIKASLRVRPDRIIVGEVRGGETLDMLQAMNTGHDGSMSTGHGNSPSDMMTRLETMVLMGIDMPLAAIRAQIATAIDIVIHLGRMRDKTRKVLEINEVVGIRNGQIELNRLYVFKEEPESDKNKVVGQLERTENPLINKQKLERKGLA
jgi:pilus assembly protein CpaF